MPTNAAAVSSDTLALQRHYHWKRATPDCTVLRQLLCAGALRDDRWAQVMDEARRMAANLQSRGFAPGSRIAIISKNRMHWLRADFALWMVGFVSVLRYPTLAAGTIGQRSITATPA